MDSNDIISLGPGFILDTFGPTTAPIQRPTPVLPGSMYNFRGRGLTSLPPGSPNVRGSIRVTFRVPDASVLPPGNVYVIAGIGSSFDPITSHGTSIIMQGDNSIGFVYANNAIGLLYFYVGSTLPAPVGIIVTVTGSWDSQTPIDGPYHAKLHIEGFGTCPCVMGINGDFPWSETPPILLGVAEDISDSPFVENFPEEVGRFQLSNQVVLGFGVGNCEVETLRIIWRPTAPPQLWEAQLDPDLPEPRRLRNQPPVGVIVVEPQGIAKRDHFSREPLEVHESFSLSDDAYMGWKLGLPHPKVGRNQRASVLGDCGIHIECHTIEPVVAGRPQDPYVLKLKVHDPPIHRTGVDMKTWADSWITT